MSDDQPRDDQGKFASEGGGGIKAWAKESQGHETGGAGAGVKAWAAGTKTEAAGGKPKASPAPDFSKMKVLGEGANRKVHDAGDGTVIKVAKNAAARKDNKMEVESSGKHPLLATVSEHGEKHAWVKQEKLDPASTDDLAKHFGVSAADAKKKYNVTIKDAFGFPTTVGGKDWLFAATHAANGGTGERPKSGGKFEAELRSLKAAVPKIDLTDLAYANQWGKDKHGKAKIADYGFSG